MELKNFAFIIIKWQNLQNYPYAVKFQNFRAQPRKFTKLFLKQNKMTQESRSWKILRLLSQSGQINKILLRCEISEFPGATPEVYKTTSQTK